MAKKRIHAKKREDLDGMTPEEVLKQAVERRQMERPTFLKVNDLVNLEFEVTEVVGFEEVTSKEDSEETFTSVQFRLIKRGKEEVEVASVAAGYIVDILNDLEEAGMIPVKVRMFTKGSGKFTSYRLEIAEY